MFNGVEVSRTGSRFQSGYGPKRQETTRPDHGMRAPVFKRRHQGSPEGGDIERPQYGVPSQNHLERKQAAGSKRRRQGIADSGEPPSFQSNLEHARSTFGSGLRPEAIFEAGVRNYGSQHQGEFGSARPLFGSRLRPEDAFGGGMPEHVSRLPSGLENARLASNLERREHDANPDGTSQPLQSGPTDSRLREEGIYEGGVPGYGSRVQNEFVSAGQELGYELRPPFPTGFERKNAKSSAVMTGPKRRVQPPPAELTSQQGMSGAAKVGTMANAKIDDGKWKKKQTIEKCPAVVQNEEVFVELRCDRCHCNSSAVTGKFWKGIIGIQSHLRRVHKETLTPTEIFARCSVRLLSAEEVKRIGSGEVVIEKVRYKAVKGAAQTEGATGRTLENENNGVEEQDDEEEDDEDEEEEETQPVRGSPKRRMTQGRRDFTKAKVTRTTW